MKVVNIHRVLKFWQSNWLKKFVEYNTEKRMHAVNDFEKDFFELMVNCVYGKTTENLRKRVNVKLVIISVIMRGVLVGQLLFLKKFLIIIWLLFTK